MIICKWPDPLVDHLQVTEVTRVTGVTRGDRTEGGEEGEKKEKKENCRGRNGWTTSKALYEVLADLTRNWVGMNGPLIKAEKRDEKKKLGQYGL